MSLTGIKTPLEEFGKIEIEPERVFSPPRERDKQLTKRKDISPSVAASDPKRNRTNSKWFNDEMTEDMHKPIRNETARNESLNFSK